jgi:hypothetical protein
MILPLLLVSLAVAGQSARSLECGNIVTSTSDFRVSPAGLRVALKVHTEDDHSKNSHDCMSEYTLMIVRQDGTSTENQMYSEDDEWGRTIKFWLDGFASKGQELVATTREGKSWELLVFDLNRPDHSPAIFDLPDKFLYTLSPSCRESLRTVGMTSEGEPVIGVDTAVCGKTRRLWKVKQGRLIPANSLSTGGELMQARPIRLGDHAVFERLDPGTALSN